MKKTIDLLSTIEAGGCSAKLPAGMLKEILKNVPQLNSENLLVGNDKSDDALVYKIDDNTAIIQTTDFFPPVCSDPYEFGQIAAANALSDVFAMGGKVITALNIALFPSADLDSSVLNRILVGGADKVIEAGGVLAGGHTIDNNVPIYGLSVTGIVHPDAVITNDKAVCGDALVLTKGLGTGVIGAGMKTGLVDEKSYRSSVDSMKQLNRLGAEIMQKYNVRCATDITGFGLCGHALELAQASQVSVKLDTARLPVLGSVYDLLDAGCIPGAAFRNLTFVEERCHFSPTLDYNLKMLAMDAQTSGGLLMSCNQEHAADIVNDLQQNGYLKAAVVGEVVPLQNSQSIIELN